MSAAVSVSVGAPATSPFREEVDAIDGFSLDDLDQIPDGLIDGSLLIEPHDLERDNELATFDFETGTIRWRP